MAKQIFAARDIAEKNLKVSAGYPLPGRFQDSQHTLRSLKETLGSESLIIVDENTVDHILISTVELKALRTEVAKLLMENGQLKEHIEAMGKARRNKE